MAFTPFSDPPLQPTPRSDSAFGWSVPAADQHALAPPENATGNSELAAVAADEVCDRDCTATHPLVAHVPRFSLRTVFIALSVLCAGLALATTLQTVWLVLLLWVSLMVLAHVGGNLSGSSVLRGDRTMDEGPAFISPRVIAAPSTHLREKATFGRKMIIFTATSAAIGGLIALAYLIFGVKTRPPILGLLVGGVSAAVIGGQVGFLAGSFVNVFRTAFRQASGKLPPSEPL